MINEEISFLFILGCSGSGKTFLANKIAETYPDYFQKIIQCTSREKRPEETQDVDYHFMSRTSLEEAFKNEEFIGKVEKQFSNIYGTRLSECSYKKTNILVLSIEGLVDALFKIKELEESGMSIYTDILFIDNVKKPDIERAGRDAQSEEIYTRCVLNAVAKHEIENVNVVNYEEFKEYRDDIKKVLLEKIYYNSPCMKAIL